MLERNYQRDLIKKIKLRLPEAVILKNDSSYIQGIPDLLVLNGPSWGALEVKANSGASFQANQEYYLAKMDAMSFAAMICPENEREVLNALQLALETRGSAFIS